jgi:RNA polymerase sigma-70 factor (ECF subfamily)
MRFSLSFPQEACFEQAQRLRDIFDRHAAFVWRTLRNLGVAGADLEDATQEVFVVVHARLATYQERDKMRSWLYAICVRVSQHHRRSHARRRERVSAEVPERAAAATQQAELEQREALALGQRLLAVLPEAQREVFLLYEIEHMTMAEVAAIVGCPLQTAYARLHKARERVKAEVESLRARGELP